MSQIFYPAHPYQARLFQSELVEWSIAYVLKNPLAENVQVVAGLRQEQEQVPLADFFEALVSTTGTFEILKVTVNVFKTLKVSGVF